MPNDDLHNNCLQEAEENGEINGHPSQKRLLGEIRRDERKLMGQPKDILSDLPSLRKGKEPILEFIKDKKDTIQLDLEKVMEKWKEYFTRLIYDLKVDGRNRGYSRKIWQEGVREAFVARILDWKRRRELGKDRVLWIKQYRKNPHTAPGGR
ncbi:unnamed protein product [Nezara viridula]|uniref:Uncharacterized protein n=1 Tax=Nezara viridula TaxID=85310 RepID=A0A9P0E2W7_NEZVI|nr:unnamed protein product [Nezara viridula]